MSDLENGRKYKAISIRYKPEDWERLQIMKEQYEHLAGIDITMNSFIKQMTSNGFDIFRKVAAEYYG